VTRRSLVRRFLLCAASTAAGLAHRPGWLRAGTEPRGDTSLDSATLPLSATEVEALVSFAEVVAAGDRLSAEARRHVASHVAESASEDGAQRMRYRETAGLLDRLAGSRFAALAIDDRRSIVARHRLDRSAMAAGERSDQVVEGIRGNVVPDLIRAYWNSPDGWAVVGYSAFPGRCSDLARYTAAEPG
jgi:hypothetical protein